MPKVTQPGFELGLCKRHEALGRVLVLVDSCQGPEEPRGGYKSRDERTRKGEGGSCSVWVQTGPRCSPLLAHSRTGKWTVLIFNER